MSSELFDEVAAIQGSCLDRDGLHEQVALAQQRMLMRSLVELKLTADRVRRGQDELEETALRLRAAGASWGMLGLALGITRQAAQQRFGATS